MGTGAMGVGVFVGWLDGVVGVGEDGDDDD